MKGIITLCGSTKFAPYFDFVSQRLTMNDWAVFSLGSHIVPDKLRHWYRATQLPDDTTVGKMLIALHKDKIRKSNAIFVVDVDGYIGFHTRAEVRLAKKLRLKIYYWSKGDLDLFEAIE